MGGMTLEEWVEATIRRYVRDMTLDGDPGPMLRRALLDDVRKLLEDRANDVLKKPEGIRKVKVTA